MKLGRARKESSEASKSSAQPSRDPTLQPAAKRFSAMEPSKSALEEDLTNIPPSPAYVLSFSFSKRLDEKIARMEADEELGSKTSLNVDDITDHVTKTRRDSTDDHDMQFDDEVPEEEGSKASSKVSEGVVKQAILSMDFKADLAKSVRDTDLGEDFIARSIEDPGFLTSSLNDPKFVKKNPTFVAKIKGLISVATGKVFGKSKKKRAEKQEEKKRDDDLFAMDDVKGADSTPLRSTGKLAAATSIQKQPKLGRKFVLKVSVKDIESDDDEKDPLSASMGSSALKAALTDSYTPSSPTASAVLLGSSVDPALQFKALTDTALLKYDSKGKAGTRFMSLLPASREIVWSKKRARRSGKGVRSMQLDKVQKIIIGPRSSRFSEVDWISRKPWLFCTIYDGEQTLDIEFNNDFQMSAWFDAFRALGNPGTVPSVSKVRWQKATLKVMQEKLKSKTVGLRKFTS